MRRDLQTLPVQKCLCLRRSNVMFLHQKLVIHTSLVVASCPPQIVNEQHSQIHKCTKCFPLKDTFHTVIGHSKLVLAWCAFGSLKLFTMYIKVHMATRWTIRHALMLLWLKDLMNVTEKLQFIDFAFRRSCLVPSSGVMKALDRSFETLGLGIVTSRLHSLNL